MIAEKLERLHWCHVRHAPRRAVLPGSQDASGFRACFTCETVRSSLSGVVKWRVSSRWSLPSSVRVSSDRAGRPLLLRRWIAVGAGFGWIPRGSLCSTDHGVLAVHWRVRFYGCDDGWIEEAFDHLSTDGGLAGSFYISYVLCLTEETASMVCPTEKVANFIGISVCLAGSARWCAAALMWARTALSLSVVRL